MLSKKLFVICPPPAENIFKLRMWLSCKFVLCPSVYTGVFPVLSFFFYLCTDVVTESKQIKYHGCQNSRLYINANNALSASDSPSASHVLSIWQWQFEYCIQNVVFSRLHDPLDMKTQ